MEIRETACGFVDLQAKLRYPVFDGSRRDPSCTRRKNIFDHLRFFSEYDGITLYYNPYGEPEIPDEYLGMGT